MSQIIENLPSSLTPEELSKWRDGYRRYLESKGLPSSGAEATASKVAYRPDLYPTVPPIFQLVPPPFDAKPTTQPESNAPTKVAKPSPASIPPKPKSGPVTRRELKLIEVSSLIASEPPSGEDMAFTHAVLCQVGLPRSKVDGEKFMRQSGSACCR